MGDTIAARAPHGAYLAGNRGRDPRRAACPQPVQTEEIAMRLRQMTAHPRFLPRVLLLDAVASGATAALLVAAADVLAPVLALPAGLLRGAGVALLPFVALVYGLSRREAPPRRWVAAVVAVNLAWVVASAWVAFGGAWRPSPVGVAFVLAQALAVLAFAELGWFGLRARRVASAGLA
jgi:hypothetical protein